MDGLTEKTIKPDQHGGAISRENNIDLQRAYEYAYQVIKYS